MTSRGVLGVSAGDGEAHVVTMAGVDDLTVSQGTKRLGSGKASPVSFSRAARE